MLPVFDRDLASARSQLYQKIRQYFQERNVLEVEVPSLGCGGSIDVHLQSMSLEHAKEKLYLQTSPEFFMKRLLCEGSGDIFTICKAFRGSEEGPLHNPEFSMLEWYRQDFSLEDLIEDVVELLRNLGIDQACSRLTYADAFEQAVGVNPHKADFGELEALAKTAGLVGELDVSGLLDFIATMMIERSLPAGLVVLEEFPVCQAELARLGENAAGEQIARRFEIYLNGVELANGYEELTDGVEQRSRFNASALQRRSKGLPAAAFDEGLLAAVDSGMPECSGVALGLDRLLMIMGGQKDISQSLLFPWARL